MIYNIDLQNTYRWTEHEFLVSNCEFSMQWLWSLIHGVFSARIHYNCLVMCTKCLGQLLKSGYLFKKTQWKVTGVQTEKQVLRQTNITRNKSRSCAASPCRSQHLISKYKSCGGEGDGEEREDEGKKGKKTRWRRTEGVKVSGGSGEGG